jgi:hypothetical protein
MGFLVNSNISKFIQQRPHMLVCQVLIKESDYWFLSRDSYLDCSQLFPFDEVELVDGRGPVTDQTKNEIKNAVANAVTIENHYKQLISKG